MRVWSSKLRWVPRVNIKIIFLFECESVKHKPKQCLSSHTSTFLARDMQYYSYVNTREFASASQQRVRISNKERNQSHAAMQYSWEIYLKCTHVWFAFSEAGGTAVENTSDRRLYPPEEIARISRCSSKEREGERDWGSSVHILCSSAVASIWKRRLSIADLAKANRHGICCAIVGFEEYLCVEQALTFSHWIEYFIRCWEERIYLSITAWFHA